MAIDYTPPMPSPYLRFQDPGADLATKQGGTGAGVAGSSDIDPLDVPSKPQPLTLPPLMPPVLGQGSLGSSAVDGPFLPPVSSMGNLSAADMLQIIRKEIKNIAEALQTAQAQVIKSNQSTIEAKSQATITKLNEAIEKLQEAQEIKDAMSIFNKVMYGVMGVVLALLTPMMACMPPLAVLAWGAFAAYITVNEKDNGKIMEDCMNEISEAFGVAWESEGKDKQRENGMIAFTSFMASIQILIAIIAIVASFGSATPAVAATTATTTATQIALAATQTATTAAAAAGTSAASAAATAAATAASTAAATAASTAAATAASSAATAATTAATTAASSAATAATTAATSAATSAATAASTSATTAASSAATAASTSATTAASSAATAASTAASTASSSASSAASAAGTTAQTVATAAQKLAGLVQAGVTIGTSSAKITAGVYDYQGTMMKADAEETKAQIKMLQNLLKNEMDFLQQLVSVQAELDKGVASILRDEHQTNQKMQQITHFS
jgi:hypothetical protein